MKKNGSVFSCYKKLDLFTTAHASALSLPLILYHMSIRKADHSLSNYICCEIQFTFQQRRPLEKITVIDVFCSSIPNVHVNLLIHAIFYKTCSTDAMLLDGDIT